ncbi:LysR family transcriptional regulator [Actinosynnema pretiosum]|uniref:LysR family transcriptional regulator n=2 Tax=Actinosynnema TaxID=40566 RepID=A0A290ZAF6_9PSEU|nr:LysR substrate-binding domain-containing protein [Actinosynnema pretiosum]ATE55988.1 LysR family transcriptional regulator [Actinosynnema pretiosum]
MDLRLLRYFVAVAEERHYGRAAARLHMTQPPLSRAIRRLERDLGVVLLVRSASGVELTGAGSALHAEAVALLERADLVRSRVAGADASLTVGTLGASGAGGARLAEAFRERHPAVRIVLREADFTDPTAGVRGGLVDVALARTPFDPTGIGTRVLRLDPVGAVLRADDPLAGRSSLTAADLVDRPWFRLPDGVDPAWRAFWSGPGAREGAVVRTVAECAQAVLWNGSVGIAPLGEPLGRGLAWVPLADVPPSPLVVAWREGGRDPLVRSFARIAVEVFRG